LLCLESEQSTLEAIAVAFGLALGSGYVTSAADSTACHGFYGTSGDISLHGSKHR